MPAFQRLFTPVEEYRLTGWLFVKLLSLIYLVAFASLAVQISGLVGPEGILPVQEQLDGTFDELGRAAWLWLPTLFWVLEPTDLVLQGTALSGCLLSLLLLFGGRWRRPLLILLFLLYLSLYHAGQIFTNFQWDTLLLEAGFLSIFLLDAPSRMLIFLFEWLLFRLRFMSGFFKLATGDPSWSGFTALNYYFETQPIPHFGAWYFHQLPEWLLRAGVGLTFFSELVVPFFIFLPRRFRLFAVGVTLLMQLLILSSSNHNFFNLLTIVLCLFLLDDRIVGRLLPARKREALLAVEPRDSRLNHWLVGLAWLLILPASLAGFGSYALHRPLPTVVQGYVDGVNRFGLGMVYHVFPNMQTERQELKVEGSNDGENWQAYRYRFAPEALDQTPPFIVPHQPRLDWMLWFVPTQRPVQMLWFGEFLRRLHEGSPSVLKLLAYNPFPEAPPLYLRVVAYQYHFTSPEERARTGNWWRRDYLGLFPYIEPRRP